MCLHYLAKLIARVLKHGVDFVRGSVRLMTSSFSCLERMGYLAETNSSSFRPCYAASSPICWHVDFAGADNLLAVWHWVTARFRRLQQEPGIRCLVMLGTCLPCSPSAVNSRLYCLGCRTLSIDSFSAVSWHWHCKVVLQQ